MPAIDKMVGAKLQEAGLKDMSSLKLNSSIFVKDNLVLSDNAKSVLKRRYLKKDSRGRLVESPRHMFKRVARHIARAEKKYGDESDIETNGRNLLPHDDGAQVFAQLPHIDERRPQAWPAGRLFRPAGGRQHGRHLRLAEKRRPDPQIRRRNRIFIFPPASQRQHGWEPPAVLPRARSPFMKIFNTATEQVKQGGTRRGANMAI
jgi:ribonucleoside-diphosphate reductase alpha chain